MKLWSIIRAQPVMTILALSMVGATGTGVGYTGYWTLLQPDPQILAVESPVTNRGVDGNGRTMVEWVNAGRPARTFEPIPTDTFKAGEVMYTVRYDCFLYKTSGPLTRTFRSIDTDGKPTGSDYPLPLSYPPSRTNGCARRNFPTPIPETLPPGRYRYEVAVLFWKNPMQPEVRTMFPSVDVTVLPK